MCNQQQPIIGLEGKTMTPSEQPLPSSHQKYWDACLIKAWRDGRQLQHAVLMFESITNQGILDCNLKRTPPPGMMWKMGVRVFVAEYLPKISERLWNQEPSKDAALLNALEKSNYTSCKRGGDLVLAKIKRQTHQNESKASLLRTKVNDRNRGTDWGVTKAPSRCRHN
jgi:hypothetical protein